MTEVLLREGERIDELNRAGFRIIQNPKTFCFGMDAVLLAAFASAGKGDKVCDLGTGTGIIPILMAARQEAVSSYDCIEIQSISCDMASRSVALNNLQEHIKVHECDIANVTDILKAHSYDVVTSNPPYMRKGAGLKNPTDFKCIARHEILTDIDGVAKSASELLKSKGAFYLVHRPTELSRIFDALKKYSLEPKVMRLVYPKANADANMVLIKAVKDAGVWLDCLAPLVIYDENGEYTKEVSDIYYG